MSKCQNFLCTSVKTLSLQPVGPHGQSDPFSRSNEPWSVHTLHLEDFRVVEHHFFGDLDSDIKNINSFVDVHQDLSCATRCSSQLVRPIFKVKRVLNCTYLPFKQFSCVLAHHIWVIWTPMSENSKCFCGRPWRSFLCIRLDIMASMTHFQGRTSPEARITPI